jgi:predicted metal-binding protein
MRDSLADPVNDTRTAPVTLYVCATCRAAGDASEPRAGAQLLAALQDAVNSGDHPGITVASVECLSVCKRPCTVAVASEGRWTYVYGDLDAAASARTILEGVGLYAGTPDGIVPWKARPPEFRTGVVARIPPFPPLAATRLPDAAE